MRDRLRAGGGYEHLETKRQRKDGSWVDVLITASSSKDEAGEVVGLSVIARDITERVTAERALEASLRRLAEAQRTAQLGSFEFDVTTGDLTWSEEYSRILGLDPSVAASSREVRLHGAPGRRGDGERGVGRCRRTRSTHRPAVPHHSTGRAGSLRARSRCAGVRSGRFGSQGCRHDDGQHRAGRSGQGETGGGAALRDRLRTIRDRCCHLRSRRNPVPRQPGGLPVLRAAGGPAGRPTLDRLHPPGRGPARPGRTEPSRGRSRHIRGRASLHPTGWLGRVGVDPRDPRSRRESRARVLLRTAPGHHRSQGHGAGARPSGAARLLDRASQSRPADRPPGPRACPGQPTRVAHRRDVPRRRPLQDGQRLVGAQRRRRSVASTPRTASLRRSVPATRWPGSAATSS